MTAERASPRAVIYTIDGTLASGFIVADGSIKMKVSNPTISTVIACLMAAYYAWDVDYPAAFRNTLSYLDFKIFGASIDKQFSLEKFNRKLNSKLEKK